MWQRLIRLCVAIAVCLAATARADVQDMSGPQKIEADALYQALPETSITTREGTTSIDKLGAEKPFFLAFFFRRCTGTCNPFLKSLKSATDKVGGLGERYNVVSVSFDPDDSLDDVVRHAQSLGFGDDRSWKFGVSTPDDIRRLTAALKFWYQKNEASGQYDHPSVVFAIRNGRVIRTLVGNIVDAGRIREAVWEMRGVFVPFYASTDSPFFRCFQYDPDTGRLLPDWGLLFLVTPPVVALSAVAAIFRRRRKFAVQA